MIFVLQRTLLVLPALAMLLGCSNDVAGPDPVDAADASSTDVSDGGSIDAALDAADVADSAVACLDESEITLSPRGLLAPDEQAQPPRDAISDVQAIELDGDDAPEFVLAEPGWGRLRMLDGCEVRCSVLDEIPIEGVPVRVEPLDVDNDGSIELVVAALGIFGTVNEQVGSVQIVRQVADGWQVDTVATDLYRVGCVRPADVDADGWTDVVVCEFGAIDGYVGVLWGREGGFDYDRIYDAPGAVELDVSDTDGDGRLDVVVAIAQLQEEVLTLEQTASRTFVPRVLFEGGAAWFGHSSLRVADADGDGADDIVFTNGDPDDLPTETLPEGLHGLNVLWHRGEGEFVYERLVDFDFAFDATVADLDGDCDPEIVVFSAPTILSDVVTVPQDHTPALLVRPSRSGAARVQAIETAEASVVASVAVDIDGDGDLDIVAGAFSLTGEVGGDLLFALENERFP